MGSPEEQRPEERARAACEERAARAEALAAGAVSGAELLRFAAGLFRAQASVLPRLDAFEGVAAAVRPVLEYAAARGPSGLSQDARAALQDVAAFAERLRAFRAGGAFDYLARAALAPWAVLQREKGGLVGSSGGPCNFCGGVPWMASLSGGAELQGAARMLHCGTCWQSWQVSRIRCPACGEQDPPKLPAFSEAAHPGVRIEACDTCKGYLKSIDRSTDARRIPEVDDLASLAMDLWAMEQGYERLEPGLAGL